MSHRGHFGWRHTALALVGVGLLAELPVPAAGPPPRVKFSGSFSGTNVVDFSPETLQRNRELERLKQGLGPRHRAEETPDVPFLPAPAVQGTTTFRNKKLQDLLDRRANWIFEVDESKETSLLEGADDQEASGALDQGKSKRPMEKYLEKVQKERKNTETAKRSEAKNKDDAEERDANRKESQTEAATRAQTPWRPGDPWSGSKQPERSETVSPDEVRSTLFPPDNDGFSTSFRGGGLTSREERMRLEKQQADRDWLQLLRTGTPRLGNPAATPGDPINQMVDTSRTPLQPVTGSTFPELDGLGKNRPLTSPVPGMDSPFNRDRALGLGGFNDLLNTRVFGSAGFTPSFTETPTPLLPASRPAILDVPHRKF